MSIEPNDPLEQSLRGLAWWPGPAPGLWKKALHAAGRKSAPPGQGGLQRTLRSRWPWIGLPLAAMIVAAATVAINERARRATRTAQDFSYALSIGEGERPQARPGASLQTPAPSVSRSEYPSWKTTGGLAYFKLLDGGRHRHAEMPPKSFVSASAATTQPHPDALDRHVIRKAAIDLQADDVRGVYLKIQTLLPNEAAGEYVEQSQIHDTSGQLSAYITLRVRAEHLSEVLNALRGLATVVREQSDASDVTAQVFDIEARLRNERRVEQELLALLDKRKDAPLEDVLKLSTSLAEVRGRIESLTADQQRIARQVALASIVVTIQPKAARPPSHGTGARLRETLASAWKDGLALLIDSFAALVRVVIGGLIWWLLLILMLVLLRRWYLRRTPQA